MFSRKPKVYTPFPKDFLWGSACAAHQVHGSPGSNWDVWERSPRRKQELIDLGVAEDRHHEFIAGNACEFEKRFPHDLSMARAFGHNTIRFSVNWATIEPRPGEYDTGVLENYRAMCNMARAMGLTIVITFYHWTHRNGFEWYDDNAASSFEEFVKVTLPYLGDIKYFTVFNEPNVYLHMSYRWNEWPPQIADEDLYRRALNQQIAAYRLAHRVIRKALPAAKIGIGQAFAWHTADTPELKAEKDQWQYEFLDAIRDKMDFVGIQLYMHAHFSHDPSRERFGWLGADPCTDNPVQSDMIGAKAEHWGMCPEAIYRVVVEAYERYGLPVMVTEHGHAIPEMMDDRRCWYIWESLRWLERAIKDGIPLIGYLHWSLMDNFEWKFGWGPKFGLFHVDRMTQQRTPRRSAILYKDICEAGGLCADIALRYREAIAHPFTKRIA